MSLINQMLQDLEQRKADGGATAAQVRAATRPAKSSPAFRGWLFFFLLVIAAGAGYWIFSTTPAKKTPPPAVPSATARIHEPNPPDSTPDPVATPSVLQLASELSILPSPRPAEQKARDTVSPAALPKQEVAAPPTAEKTQAIGIEIRKSAMAPESSIPAGINKEIRQPSPHQRAENSYRQAYSSLQQGRMGEAEENLRLALQLDPRHAAARQALAGLLVESRRLERAEQILQQGLELQPGNSGYAMTLARIQVERGDVTAALATLQRNPPASENAEYHGFLAALLQRSDKHKDAIDHYLAALRTNPGSGPWLLGLGISLQADGQSAKAAEIFRRARQSGSLSPELQAFAEQRLKALQ